MLFLNCCILHGITLSLSYHGPSSHQEERLFAIIYTAR